MADVKKIATRASYGEALVELGAEHDDFVVLDADLAAATQTGKFKAAYPDRFYDAGIAEENLMGMAAGIATTGHVAFASTFAMFAAGRAFEQVRNSIGYPHLNVKIGATHAGISVGEDGATHQCNEDIALMRTIPGMTVIVPSDDVEAKAAVLAAREEREKQRAARLRGRVVELDVRRVQKPNQILAKIREIVERGEQNEAFGDVARFLADRLPERKADSTYVGVVNVEARRAPSLRRLASEQKGEAARRRGR